MPSFYRNYFDFDGNASVGVGRLVIAMSAGCEYMGCTRGPGIVSSAYEVLEMSVVRGMRGVCVVCDMCMYLTRGRAGLEARA